MRYVCSKNYKILCKEDCYHVKNIKEENMVWFDTISEGINYGCRPCKHCLSYLDEDLYDKALEGFKNWIVSASYAMMKKRHNPKTDNYKG